MSWTIDFTTTMLTSACGAWFIWRAVARFLPLGQKRWQQALSYLIFTLTLANASWVGDANPLLLFPFFMAAFLLCYGGTWYARLICGGIFFSLLESLCMMVDTAGFVHRTMWMQSAAPQLIKLAASILLWALTRRRVQSDGSLYLSGKLWGLLGALTLAPLFSTLSFTIWQASFFDYDAYQNIVRYIAYTILPFVMLSALALLTAVVVLARHEMLEQQRKLAEMQEIYYLGLKREQEGVRTLRHDLHNHIAAAQVLLADGDTDGAQQYLAQLSRSPVLLGGSRYCENDIANAVLASKIPLMEQRDIAYEMQVSLPQTLPFPDIELCALLGNALDNALEAAARAADRRVAVRARADRGMLMLRVENTLAKAPKTKNGRFMTDKKDTAHHGLGFAAMSEIAQRHGGQCEAEYDASMFRLLVSIPLAP